jgi:hypothetical protein
VDQSDTDHRPGSSSWNDGPDEKKRFETWRHSNWEDEAFVDRFELKIRGIELNFERRVTLAEQSANVSENIVGPHGKTAHEFSIKVAELATVGRPILAAAALSGGFYISG